ncbi:hypothetical protein QJQ45_015413 [Haematococcus lacustris]|nr:hypothetical protein QJQ45_015413 [Haematococcus lacustris]
MSLTLALPKGTSKGHFQRALRPKGKLLHPACLKGSSVVDGRLHPRPNWQQVRSTGTSSMQAASRRQARGPASASPGQQQGVDPYQDKSNRVSDPASLLGLHSEPLSEPNSSLLGLLHIMEPNSSWGTDLSSRMSLLAGTNTATNTTSTPSAGVSALMSELSGLHAYTMPGNGMGSHSSRERSSRERSSRSSTLGTRQLALMAAAPAVAGVLEEEDKEAAAAGTAQCLSVLTDTK